MQRIAFLINTLGGGGAERVLVNLVNNMNLNLFDITIITMFDTGINANSLKTGIRLINRNPFHIKGLSKIIKYIKPSLLYRFYIRKRNYDIIVAYMHGAPTRVLWGTPKNIIKIAWLHTQIENSSLHRYFISKKALTNCCKSLNAIVGVSDTVCESFTKYTGIHKNVIRLYNALDTENIKKKSNCFVGFCTTNKNVLKIISLGRLSEEKGYERLAHVIKRLSDDGLSFEVFVMGCGSEEIRIKDSIKRLKIEKQMHLLGFKENPYPYVKEADLYLCCSYQEGLNTAMCEALVLGTPVVTTAVSGAYEILGDNNEYGIVSENSIDGLYVSLKRLIEEPELVCLYRSKAKERGQIFNCSESVKLVEDLFLRFKR